MQIIVHEVIQLVVADPSLRRSTGIDSGDQVVKLSIKRQQYALEPQQVEESHKTGRTVLIVIPIMVALLLGFLSVLAVNHQADFAKEMMTYLVPAITGLGGLLGGGAFMRWFNPKTRQADE